MTFLPRRQSLSSQSAARVQGSWVLSWVVVSRNGKPPEPDPIRAPPPKRSLYGLCKTESGFRHLETQTPSYLGVVSEVSNDKECFMVAAAGLPGKARGKGVADLLHQFASDLPR